MSLLDVIAGGAIATGTTFGLQWWQAHRDGQSATAKAAAEWDALQMTTIADLQESLESGASAVSITLADAATSRFGRFKLPDMVPFTRALMLCSRLDDEQLAKDIRAWIVDNRELIGRGKPVEADWIAIRNRRIALQDRLGVALKAYHGR